MKKSNVCIKYIGPLKEDGSPVDILSRGKFSCNGFSTSCNCNYADQKNCPYYNKGSGGVY